MNMPLVLLNRRRRGGSFSPYSLFSGTAIGTWLDPSDLSTMFSDRAGTTPVTTPGTVVGLRLDKSKGLVLGSELVTNGTFATDTDWTKGTGWTISGGEAVFTPGTGSVLSQNLSGLSTTKSYIVSFSLVTTASTITLRFGSSGVNTFSGLTTGNYSYRIPPGGTVGIYFVANGATACTLDNISVRELAGNHAVAPTDAARPIYGVEPKGGRRNLLTYSEDFSNATWVKSGTTASAHNVVDPDGGTTASTITATTASGYFFYNTSSNPTSGSTAPSLWIRRRTGSGDIRLRTSAGGADTPVSVTSSWQRISVVCTATAAISNCWVLSIATSGDAIDIWHPQLELGSTATNYQKVTTAYDVTESGVATCHYVQYDGSDDSMSTSAIDFTATDKMSVFAGVRRSAVTSSYQCILETSASTDSNNGVLALFSENAAAGARIYAQSKGTVAVQAYPSAGVFPNVTTSVVAGLGDISGDTITLRKDGTQVAQATTDQGTGNFGNYPLFIGRRNNATLPFNGRDYGIIIVGKAASAGEITDTETWLAAKTAQVTI